MQGAVLDRLKTALSDRYTIERELGAGGMATVGGFVSRADEPGLGSVDSSHASLKDAHARPWDGVLGRARTHQGATRHLNG